MKLKEEEVRTGPLAMPSALLQSKVAPHKSISEPSTNSFVSDSTYGKGKAIFKMMNQPRKG